MSICGNWSHWKLSPLVLCMEELVAEQGSAVAPTTGSSFLMGLQSLICCNVALSRQLTMMQPKCPCHTINTHLRQASRENVWDEYLPDNLKAGIRRTREGNSETP